MHRDLTETCHHLYRRKNSSDEMNQTYFCDFFTRLTNIRMGKAKIRPSIKSELLNGFWRNLALLICSQMLGTWHFCARAVKMCPKSKKCGQTAYISELL